MLKKSSLLLLLVFFSSYANSQTSLQIQMMQNRVVKTDNAEILMVSICDALMDMKSMARCFGVNAWGGINYHKNINPNYKKALDETIYQFISISSVVCGGARCQQITTIDLTKADEKRYKINIKVVEGAQVKFDNDVYKKYFDAIGNSLFLNKAGVELGALSE
jgi:hypothetical protein